MAGPPLVLEGNFLLAYRKGIVERRPPVVLEGEVECDEVYVVAGHKGHPEAVKKKAGPPAEGA